ncbi:alkaline phosphatase family protein [Caldithrix abyssi]
MNERKQLVVIALDGVPFSLLKEMVAQGIMPHVGKLLKESALFKIDSVHPPISSVAWASFWTGAKPAEHGITGFIERDPATLEWFVPNAKHLKKKTLLQLLSEAGKRVFSLNVPVTYPPIKVNGIVVSGFLGSDLAKGTYPPAIGSFLKAKGYRIDADVEAGKKDPDKFYHQLIEIMEKRFEMLCYFYENGPWDFFMGHIMETDRLHHFFWRYYEETVEPYSAYFFNFYQKLDSLIGQFLKRLPDDAPLLLLSDHGFTRLKYEVNLNRWLMENGYLYFKQAPPQSLKDLHEFTTAYSLYPGRIYLNLKGREKTGKVQAGIEYETICNELNAKLMQLKDPDGKSVVQKVVRGYERYGLPKTLDHQIFVDPLQFKNIPDLLVLPEEGYDFKGVLWAKKTFEQTVFNGTHTHENAFLLTRKITLKNGVKDITEVFGLIKNFFEI